MHGEVLEKHVGLDDHDFLGEGERRSVPLVACRGQLEVDDRLSRGRVKIAAAEDALAEAMKIKPHPGRVYLLVIGLGSEGFWGINNNGDSFPEEALLGLPPKDVAMSFFDRYVHRLPKAWGHKTFSKAHVFEEHRNSNPKLAIGGVVQPFWNNRMHRVENLIWVDRVKGKKWADRADRGDTIATSMACFTAGTMVTMANGCRKPIEEVREGEWVIAASGLPRQVKEIHRRAYRGEGFSVDTPTNDTITATAEHPWFVLPREEAVNGVRFKKLDEIDLTKARWVETQDLKPGEFLLAPAISTDATPDYADRALARLLGYYAAEGHILRNKAKEMVGVELTVHRDDAVHEEIDDLCRAYGTQNTPKTSDRSNCVVARSIVIFDRRLAQDCYRLVGSYAREKYLSEEFMAWSPELQLEFLGAYVNGDGHQNGSRWQPGSVSISTCNSQLALQLVELLKRNGILANVNYIEHRGEDTFKVGSLECQVYIGKQFANRLVGYSQKVQPFESTGKGGGQRKMIDTTILTPITGISEVDLDCDVYNLELDAEGDDHSYLVEGLIVHNCRVPFDRCSACNNLAPTRIQYCAHLRPGSMAYQLRQIRKDGKGVSMINDFPDFFDESCVENPAAPEALSIMKVASEEKVAQRKQAEIVKQDPDLPLDVAMDELEGLYHGEPTLPSAIVERLRPLGVGAAVKAASMLGMCLRPSEVLDLYFGPDKLTAKEAADLDRIALQVEPSEIELTQVVKAANGQPIYDFSRIERDVKVARAIELLLPMAPLRSYNEPYLTPRLMKCAMTKVDRLPLTEGSVNAIQVYHTLHKAAVGEYGYGKTQAIQALKGRLGDR